MSELEAAQAEVIKLAGMHRDATEAEDEGRLAYSELTDIRERMHDAVDRLRELRKTQRRAS